LALSHDEALPIIELEPVDRVKLTILVDNLTDPLLVDPERIARVNWPKALLGAVPRPTRARARSAAYPTR